MSNSLSSYQLNRRNLLAASTAVLALPYMVVRAAAKPKITVISQWSAGSDGAAITALGKLFEQAGGDWTHNPVPGFTTAMMNKLRAQILAGDPPAASQLKGPEIAAWSKIAPTVNLDAIVAASGYEKVVVPELARLHKPAGHWIALPLQVYRMNTLWVSKKAMDKVGATALPKTWAEFNALAAKMKAAGIQPLINGGLPYDNAMIWETCLAGISPASYRKAIMELDDAALRGPEVLAAFQQARRLSEWMDPNVGNQHYSVYIPKFMAGDGGMLLTGGAVQGVFRAAGYQLSDYLVGPGPQDNGNQGFTLNADSFIFWKRKESEFLAGQELMAKVLMSKETQKTFSGITGSVPARTDIDLSDPAFTPQQRETAAAMAASMKTGQVVLSLAHNLAQPSQVTAAMIDVLTEFIHNKDITPKQGQDHLVAAVAGVRS
ncbi:ABC transporter substrate-binding protein [Polaromonas jejuensis]|uniref:ABC transporter substrate-binding protein n=1 Tax=Polaromonas jejuensis TaxID=457502 RepID=A0ABW0QAI9_9BURK|nr:ABC transporter substrate-binding protein [Polaromonas jejuensis]